MEEGREGGEGGEGESSSDATEKEQKSGEEGERAEGAKEEGRMRAGAGEEARGVEAEEGGRIGSEPEVMMVGFFALLTSVVQYHGRTDLGGGPRLRWIRMEEDMRRKNLKEREDGGWKEEEGGGGGGGNERMKSEADQKWVGQGLSQSPDWELGSRISDLGSRISDLGTTEFRDRVAFLSICSITTEIEKQLYPGTRMVPRSEIRESEIRDPRFSLILIAILLLFSNPISSSITTTVGLCFPITTQPVRLAFC